MTDISYIDWYAMSDKALEETLGAYVKHHRLEQNKTQEEVARAAGISRSTLGLMEKGETVNLVTFIAVLRVLEQLDVLDAFLVKQQFSPIELAKMEKNKRERASSKTKHDNIELDW